MAAQQEQERIAASNNFGTTPLKVKSKEDKEIDICGSQLGIAFIELDFNRNKVIKLLEERGSAILTKEKEA